MDTETVVRLRATTSTDRYNKTVLGWTTPSELSLTTLAPAEPLFSAEPLEDARTRVPIGWRLYLAEGADVRPADRMRVRSKDFNVSGEPSSWMGGGLVVECERTEG